MLGEAQVATACSLAGSACLRSGLNRQTLPLLQRLWLFGRVKACKWPGSSAALVAPNRPTDSVHYHELLIAAGESEGVVYVCRHLLTVLDALMQNKLRVHLYPIVDVPGADVALGATKVLPLATSVRVWPRADEWVLNIGSAPRVVWLRSGESVRWAVLAELIRKGVGEVHVIGCTAKALRGGHGGATWLDLVTASLTTSGIRVHPGGLRKDSFETVPGFCDLSESGRGNVLMAAAEESASIVEHGFVKMATVADIGSRLGLDPYRVPEDVVSLSMIVQAVFARSMAQRGGKRLKQAARAKTQPRSTNVDPARKRPRAAGGRQAAAGASKRHRVEPAVTPSPSSD